MKAIKITQKIIDQNKKYNLALVDNPIGSIVKVAFPSKFFVTEPVSGGYETRDDLHDADGWKTPVVPNFNPKVEKLGELVDDGVDFTYTVISKTVQEVQLEAMNESLDQKQNLVKHLAEIQIVEQAQALGDEDALDNQALYPMWNDDFYYTVGFKCQDFNTDNELVLYRSEQAHASQAGWEPKNVPALFTRVAYPDEVLEWVQPLGAQDAYHTGDKVKHDGFFWNCEVDNNVWEPGVYGWEKGDAI